MLVKRFLDYLVLERNYSSQTIVVYETALRKFREFCERENEPFVWTLVEANDVRAWLVEMMDKGSAPSTAHKRLSVLRSFYKFLLMQGEITADPLRKIIAPKRTKPLPYFFRESELDLLLDRVEWGTGFLARRDRLMILLFYSTGIRRGELLALRLADIDFLAMTLKVTGKRNKQRVIPFAQELKEAFALYLKERENCAPPEEKLIFLTKLGQPLSPSYVSFVVRRRLSAVSMLKKRSPHVLRHTFATVMLNNDASLEAVKDLLGHSSLATTEIYTHTTFEELKKTYNKAHPRT